MALPFPSNSASEYDLGDRLGQGSFAQVYEGVHVKSQQHVAIKVVPKSNLTSNYTMASLQREATMMLLLRHPNIITLFEAVDDGESVYMVMELAKGGELRDLLQRGLMEEARVRQIMQEIVSALEYCHSHGVIHRDLKDENVLFNENGNVKLADFGFSTKWKKGETLETACGTPAYAAPELFLGQDYTGPEVDMWSLGVLLYQMLRGRLPFCGQTLFEVRSKVLSGMYAPLLNRSEASVTLVEGLLQLDQTSRLTVEQVMMHTWLTDNHSQMVVPFVNARSVLKLTSMPTHVKIMKQMNGLGYDKAEIEDALAQRPYSDVAATYKLLEQQLTSTGTATVRKGKDAQRIEKVRHEKLLQVHVAASEASSRSGSPLPAALPVGIGSSSATMPRSPSFVKRAVQWLRSASKEFTADHDTSPLHLLALRRNPVANLLKHAKSQEFCSSELASMARRREAQRVGAAQPQPTSTGPSLRKAITTVFGAASEVEEQVDFGLLRALFEPRVLDTAPPSDSVFVEGAATLIRRIEDHLERQEELLGLAYSKVDQYVFECVYFTTAWTFEVCRVAHLADVLTISPCLRQGSFVEFDRQVAALFLSLNRSV